MWLLRCGGHGGGDCGESSWSPRVLKVIGIVGDRKGNSCGGGVSGSGE